jgi:hypothetical protein
MRNALRDNKVWGIVEKATKIPTDPKEKDVHDALEIKAQRLLLMKNVKKWSLYILYGGVSTQNKCIMTPYTFGPSFNSVGQVLLGHCP